MSICASGASHAKSGVAAAVVVDAAYVRSLLPSALDWLYPYLPYMHALEIGDVGAFCALDPPTWTVPTAGEIFQFVTGGSVGQAGVVQDFMGTVAQAYIWHALCECTSGSTPAAPTAPTAPSGLPALNPSTLVSLPPTTPCVVATGGPTSNSSAQVGGIGVDFGLGGRLVTGGILKMHIAAGFGGGFMTGKLAVTWYDAAFATARSDQWTCPTAAGDYTFSVPQAPLNAVRVQMQALGNNVGNAISVFTGELDLYCDGAVPGGTQSVCCAPDQTLVARVNEILELVTLIQRQAVPFARVASSSHTGLSGAGHFDVQGLIGARVHCTTVPSYLGAAAGDPGRVYELGWLTWADADGYRHSEVITSADFISYPTLAGLATRLSYTFTPGVVATIQELLREP